MREHRPPAPRLLFSRLAAEEAARLGKETPGLHNGAVNRNTIEGPY